MLLGLDDQHFLTGCRYETPYLFLDDECNHHLQPQGCGGDNCLNPQPTTCNFVGDWAAPADSTMPPTQVWLASYDQSGARTCTEWTPDSNAPVYDASNTANQQTCTTSDFWTGSCY